MHVSITEFPAFMELRGCDAYETFIEPDEVHGALDVRARRACRDTTAERGSNMANRSTARSINEYIAEFPAAIQEKLEELRALIRESAPDATETISYAIPTFDLGGRHLVHFAGYAKHVGLYPAPSGIEAFRKELEPYKSGKGSVQFPLGQPLPADLIRRIVRFRVEGNTGQATKKGRGRS